MSLTGVLRGSTATSALVVGVHFVFCSIPDDVNEEKRQARLERDSKCKLKEGDEAHRTIPTSCLDPLESKLGFSHMFIYSQSA